MYHRNPSFLLIHDLPEADDDAFRVKRLFLSHTNVLIVSRNEPLNTSFSLCVLDRINNKSSVLSLCISGRHSGEECVPFLPTVHICHNRLENGEQITLEAPPAG